MISKSTPCGSPRPEESWLGSKRQWREWEMSWQTTWQSWRVSTTENPRSKDTSPGSIENRRKQTTLKCRERLETESESSRVYSLTSSLKDRQGSKPSPRTEQPPVPDQQNPWDIQTGPPWRHHTGWAHSHPVSWAKNYGRIDSHSHRHGDLDPCACAHRRRGECAGAGFQATWQEQFGRVGEKTPTGPWACPGLFRWQGRCGPARYHWLNCLLALEYIGKDCDLALRKFVGLGHCCGDPASRGCSGLASETITKAPQGHPLPQRPQGPFFLLRGPSRSVFLRWRTVVPLLFCEDCGPMWTVPAGEAIFPWNALSPLEAIGSASFIPGLCPIAAFDPAIWIPLLYPWILPGWSAMSLGDR